MKNDSAKMIAIKVMAGPSKDAGYKEPASKQADMAEDASEGESNSEEGQDWSCPECDTTVHATMDKGSMRCPCCGAGMEMD